MCIFTHQKKFLRPPPTPTSTTHTHIPSLTAISYVMSSTVLLWQLILFYHGDYFTTQSRCISANEQTAEKTIDVLQLSQLLGVKVKMSQTRNTKHISSLERRISYQRQTNNSLYRPSKSMRVGHYRPASQTPLKWRFAGGPRVPEPVCWLGLSKRYFHDFLY